jgi:hypothetical protein
MAAIAKACIAIASCVFDIAMRRSRIATTIRAPIVRRVVDTWKALFSASLIGALNAIRLRWEDSMFSGFRKELNEDDAR